MAMKNADPPLTAHGIAELRVGSIRDLGFGLDVIADSAVHAEIVNVPPEADDPKRARDIAHALAEQAVVTWIRGGAQARDS